MVVSCNGLVLAASKKLLERQVENEWGREGKRCCEERPHSSNTLLEMKG